MIEQFSKDVHEGLSNEPKNLPSKYFYNAKGDDLFQQIMDMPEYYLTKAELEIFTTQAGAMITRLDLSQHEHFELVELGAGDGTKTKELLKVLLQERHSFDYLPIDISANALDLLHNNVSQALPELSIKKQQGDYFELLHSLKNSQHPKVVLFLGSNIGNLNDDEANDFMQQLSANLNAGDTLVLGVDLIKSEEIILPAYNDESGITKAFNLNLLHRINEELEADFCLTNFEHAPEYCPDKGVAKSYLFSKEDQTVNIKKTGHSYTFKKGEKIDTEISRKYNDEVIQDIIENTGFSLLTKLTDSNNYFSDYILVNQ